MLNSEGSLVVKDAGDDWFVLEASGRNVSLFQKQIFLVPVHYRKKVPGGIFSVHKDYVIQLLEVGYRLFKDVDLTSLPEDVKHKCESFVSIEESNAPKSSFSVLFLTEDVPRFLLDAVFRILAKQCHPDVGGDPEKFKLYREAYNECKEVGKQ